MTKILRVQRNSYLPLVFSMLNLVFMNIPLKTFLVSSVSFDIICPPLSFIFAIPIFIFIFAIPISFYLTFVFCLYRKK